MILSIEATIYIHKYKSFPIELILLNQCTVFLSIPIHQYKFYIYAINFNLYNWVEMNGLET